MPGTAKNISNARSIWNVCDVWVGCSVPAAGAKPTIHTDGTPDSDANATAKHAGLLKENFKWFYKSTYLEAKSHQLTAAHRRRRGVEEFRGEGRWIQVLDSDLVDALVDGATVTSVTGGKLIEFGGKRDIASTCVYIISERVESPGKYIVIVFFDGVFTEGLEFTFDSENESSSPMGITGNAIPSRADGKQIGSVYFDNPSS